MSINSLNYSERRFLAAEALAQRESLALNDLVNWCEVGDLQAKRINNQWFIDLKDWEKTGSQLIANLASETTQVVGPRVLLLAVLLFLIGVIGFTPFQTRFRVGTSFLSGAAGTVSQTIVENNGAAVRMASVYDGLWIKLEHLWFTVDQLTKTLTNNLAYFWQEATAAWREFFRGETTPAAPPLSTLDQAVIESLKIEIKAELLRELNHSGEGSFSNSSGATPGLVVLPASGDPARDDAVKLELKNAFSDQVEVQFDPSGQAGVITPIFPSGRGENYLFILTPINRRP